MNLQYVLNVARLFDGYVDPNDAQAEEEAWPPFRKVREKMNKFILDWKWKDFNGVLLNLAFFIGGHVWSIHGRSSVWRSTFGVRFSYRIHGRRMLGRSDYRMEFIRRWIEIVETRGKILSLLCTLIWFEWRNARFLARVGRYRRRIGKFFVERSTKIGLL